MKVVARGAGTSLAGGALPMADAIVIGVSKMIDILDVDYDNRTITTAARRHQSWCYGYRKSGQILLRARSFIPACLHYCWQYRHEFWRRPIV